MNTARRVFVTGATGFFGAHIVRAFLESGWYVFAGNRHDIVPWRLDGLSNVSLLDLDLTNIESIETAVTKASPEIIVHCAAYGVNYAIQDFERALAVNVAGTAALIEMAARRRTSRFLHVGTCYEYGDVKGPAREDTLPQAKTIYGMTKAAGTMLALSLAQLRGLHLVALRPFSMYGPFEQRTKLVPSLIRARRMGERIRLTAGMQVRDYSFVSDVAKMIPVIANLDPFPSGEILNIGSGAPITLRGLIDAVGDAIDGPGIFACGEIPYRPDEVMEIYADLSKFNSLIKSGLSTSLAAGIAITAEELSRRVPEAD